MIFELGSLLFFNLYYIAMQHSIMTKIITADVTYRQSHSLMCQLPIAGSCWYLTGTAVHFPSISSELSRIFHLSFILNIYFVLINCQRDWRFMAHFPWEIVQVEKMKSNIKLFYGVSSGLRNKDQVESKFQQIPINFQTC